MVKEYGELYYLELKDLIPTNRKMTEQHREFVRFYLSKLNVDIEEDPLITISPIDSVTFGFQILDVIVEYEKRLNSKKLDK